MEDAFAHIQRGMLLRSQRRYAEAARSFCDALSRDPDNAVALSHLAACQMQLPPQQSQALKTIDRAIALEPEDPAHYELKAFILCALSRPQDALHAATEALALDPNSSIAWSASAQACLQLEHWNEAEQAARNALAHDADSTAAANQLVQALMMQNKMDEHAGEMASLLARDPENAFSHSNAGWALLKRGAYAKAQTHF